MDNNNNFNPYKPDNNNFNDNPNNSGSFNNPNITQPNNLGSFNNPNVTQPNYQQDYNQNFDPNYNQNFNQPYYNGNSQKPYDPGKGFAIGSLICGIVSLALFWMFGIAVIPGVIGIVLSVISGNKSYAVGLSRNGMATAGLVCSIIGCAINALTLFSCGIPAMCAICTAYNIAASVPYYYNF